jgi:hypothetical protein
MWTLLVGNVLAAWFSCGFHSRLAVIQPGQGLGDGVAGVISIGHRRNLP